jgi:hypothetical protein
LRERYFGRRLHPRILYSLQVQPHAASVNQSLKDLFHVAANLEDEVAAVLNLVV